MVHSMARVGRCIDNGLSEAFWGTLKIEKYYLHKFDSLGALKHTIDTYILFYNNERYQETLNGLSPLGYEGTEKLQLVPLSEVFDDSIVEYLAFLIYN